MSKKRKFREGIAEKPHSLEWIRPARHGNEQLASQWMDIDPKGRVAS
ncbi:hypothetical protein RSSM_04207 [Rhodopirellula sallentina SM41]|uniref:Uncharacterized protein n=1 Tax=Rhodopirellula sallentina SM41 TaxID=1263870 RepID=M5TYT8_9BACT|nr:hypothetical protein RSSM_04207 [Rhodopirellula sallentina SM41]